MPIVFVKETDSWEFKDPTPEEQDSLMKIAVASITDFFGEAVADQIMSKVRVSPVSINLEDTPTDEMGNA